MREEGSGVEDSLLDGANPSSFESSGGQGRQGADGQK